MRELRPFIAGEWHEGASAVDQPHKYSGETVALIHEVSQQQADAACRDLAVYQSENEFAPHARYEVLTNAANLLSDRYETFAEILVVDAGFTYSEARGDLGRFEQTLRASAEEAKRITGEMVPLHGAPGFGGSLGFTVRKPLGVVAAITPFNSPLNTVAHKVAPAIAAGNSVVLKPSAYTPLCADLFLNLLLDAGLPPRLISVLYGSGDTVGQWLLESEVPSFYAFTGSSGVGEHIRRTIGLRPSQLELGSIASTILCRDADLDDALPQCLRAAFRKAGQVCTSTQRLYVHQDRYDEALTYFADELATRRAGDPDDSATFIGPLIDLRSAERVEDWVSRAQEKGASVVTGGERTGPVMQPTVLRDVDPAMDVMCSEVFGPVVSLRSYSDLDLAMSEINDTPYGLAAGIFTSDLPTALRAADKLTFGSVHINSTSSNRVDLMPFTGLKRSGLGKEGPHYAVQEMTQEKLITIADATAGVPV